MVSLMCIVLYTSGCDVSVISAISTPTNHMKLLEISLFLLEKN